jgi:translocator protein
MTEIMRQKSGRRLWRDIGFAGLAIFAMLVALVLGQIATFPNLAPWYAGLSKPTFTPPNWIFGPVWTSLYVLMGVSLWRILRAPGSRNKTLALVFFFIQLVLNVAWSFLFFAAHSPAAGLADIVPQWLFILATIAVVVRFDRFAALCLLPLSAWVGFAAVLNLVIWRLNG